MEEISEEEIIGDTFDNYDLGHDVQEGQLDNIEGTIPKAKEQPHILNWFWRITRLREPFKLIRVGNLSNQEIGNVTISIRDSMNLAKLGKIFHHDTFSQYWEELAGITSASSMARKGWFVNQSISQVRIRGRTGGGEELTKQKRRLFSKQQEPQQ